jgi:hypothetical protein
MRSHYAHMLTAAAVMGMWCGQQMVGKAQPLEQPQSNMAVDAQPAAVADMPADGQPGTQAMTRGPIHEAYAEPVHSGSVQPIMVPGRPPAAINEVTPDIKPAAENALWIDGYWSWSDDRRDFIWVSGVWRVPPPGQQWVPGYWTEVPGGYQWVAGFWNPIRTEDVTYYPEPPASTEEGPTGTPPSANDLWVPGCWLWQESRYVWRPGYWAPGTPGWVWEPSSYYWSPSGWVFVNGYWDYPLDRRGVLFAPVYFTQTMYLRPGFTYQPEIVINPSILTFALFVRPRYSHYYFGDYYAASYNQLGIYPWFSLHSHRHYTFDPLFSYYRWYHGQQGPAWLDNLQAWDRYYREHPQQRPPHDWVTQRRLLVEAGNRPDRKFLAIGEPLRSWRDNPNSPLRLASISPEQQQMIGDAGRRRRELTNQRLVVETKRRENLVGTTTGVAPKVPERVPLPGIANVLPGASQGIMGGRQGMTAGPQGVTGAPEGMRGARVGELPQETTRRSNVPPLSATRPGQPEGIRQGTLPRETFKPINPPSNLSPSNSPPATGAPRNQPFGGERRVIPGRPGGTPDGTVPGRPQGTRDGTRPSRPEENPLSRTEGNHADALIRHNMILHLPESTRATVLSDRPEGIREAMLLNRPEVAEEEMLRRGMSRPVAPAAPLDAHLGRPPRGEPLSLPNRQRAIRDATLPPESPRPVSRGVPSDARPGKVPPGERPELQLNPEPGLKGMSSREVP